MTVGAVILAAGAATRMGRIKQLLPYRGRTLVENAIQQAQQAGFEPLIVVLGAEAQAVGEAIRPLLVRCVVNENWQSGMGSSISSGVKALLEAAPGLEAIAILLGDQPYVSAHHLSEMGRVFATENALILAAKYAGTLGVPALFRNSVFANLQSLPPHGGARALLREGAGGVQSFDLPEAAIDIDTPEDFAALR